MYRNAKDLEERARYLFSQVGKHVVRLRSWSDGRRRRYQIEFSDGTMFPYYHVPLSELDAMLRGIEEYRAAIFTHVEAVRLNVGDGFPTYRLVPVEGGDN